MGRTGSDIRLNLIPAIGCLSESGRKRSQSQDSKNNENEGYFYDCLKMFYVKNDLDGEFPSRQGKRNKFGGRRQGQQQRNNRFVTDTDESRR